MEIMTSAKGRTVALEKIIKENISNNDFIFIDGKGDADLMKKLQNVAIADGRSDEILILDFNKKD